MICSILAVAENGTIGNSKNPDSLPWPKLTHDLKWFADQTNNHVVVMGRKSWDSLGKHAPLKNRENIVITRSYSDVENGRFKGAARIILDKINENVLDLPRQYPDKKIFITGGAEIYNITADIVDEVYITFVKNSYEGDTFVDPKKLLENKTLSYSVTIPATETTPEYDMQIWKK